jgi:hypothetical protein
VIISGDVAHSTVSKERVHTSTSVFIGKEGIEWVEFSGDDVSDGE